MTASKRRLLEVTITSPDDARIAQANGADRLELCTALPLGGLTPSLATIEAVRRASDLPLLVLIRPRPAGFCYGDSDFTAMCRDADLAFVAGADGIVVGILTADGKIDRERCEKLRRLAGDGEIVFHRAFDVAADPFAALEQIIDMGFQRILTSGQEVSAIQGRSLIRQVIEHARDRIEILPGGGINVATVRDIVNATGCQQVHASLRGWKKDPTTALRPHVRFGSATASAEEQFDVTDGDAVRAVRAILDELAEPNDASKHGKLDNE